MRQMLLIILNISWKVDTSHILQAREKTKMIVIDDNFYTYIILYIHTYIILIASNHIYNV